MTNDPVGDLEKELAPKKEKQAKSSTGPTVISTPSVGVTDPVSELEQELGGSPVPDADGASPIDFNSPLTKRIAGRRFSALDPVEQAEVEAVEDPLTLYRISRDAPQLPLTLAQERALFKYQREKEGQDIDPEAPGIWSGVKELGGSAARGVGKFLAANQPFNFDREERFNSWRSAASGILEDLEDFGNTSFNKLPNYGSWITDKLWEEMGLQNQEKSFENWRSRRSYDQNIADDRLARPEKLVNVGADISRGLGMDDTAEALESAAIVPDPDIKTAAALANPADPLNIAMMAVGPVAKAAKLGKLTQGASKALGKVSTKAAEIVETGASKVAGAGRMTKDAGRSIVKGANTLGERVFGVPNVSIPGTGLLTRVVAGGMIPTGKALEIGGDLVRSVAKQAKRPFHGRKGTFELTGKSPFSSKTARALFGGSRGRILDSSLRGGMFVANKGGQGALLAPLLGFADIENSEDFDNAISAGIVGGIFNAGLYSREDVAANHIKRQQADISDSWSRMDKGTADNLTDATSFQRMFDRQNRLAQDARIQARVLERDKPRSAEAKAAKEKADQQDAYVESLKGANADTRDAYEHEMRVAISDLDNIANGIGRSSGLNNVTIMAAREPEIVQILLKNNPWMTPEQAVAQARNRGFATEAGKGPNDQRVIIDPDRPTVMVNLDQIDKEFFRVGNASLQEILGHEVAHGLMQMPEVTNNPNIKKATGQLFASETKDPMTGETISINNGKLSQEDLVKMFFTKYYSDPNEAKAAAARWANPETGEINLASVADYMRHEVMAEALGLQATNAPGSLVDELSSPMAATVDWVRAQNANSAIGRARDTLRKLGLTTREAAQSELLGMTFDPQTSATIRQALRDIQGYNGEMSPPHGYRSEAADVTTPEIIKGGKDVHNAYKDILFQTEQVITVYDKDGNVVSRSVAPEETNGGAWENQGGKVVQTDGTTAPIPSPAPLTKSKGKKAVPVPPITIPDGGRAIVSSEVAYQPDGTTPKVLTARELEARATNRGKAIQKALVDAPQDGSPTRMRLLDNGQVRGIPSESQIAAVEAMPDAQVPPQMKKMIRLFSEALWRADGTRLTTMYQAASGRKGRYLTLAPKIRDVVPISMYFSKTGNFLVTNISVSRMFDKLNSWATRNPENLTLWGGDRSLFWEDFQKYLQNWQQGLAGEAGLDASRDIAMDKKNRLNDFLNLFNADTKGTNPVRTKTSGKKGSEVDRTIMDMRIDRVTDAEISNAAPLPVDYGKAILNLVPNVEGKEKIPGPTQDALDERKAKLPKYSSDIQTLNDGSGWRVTIKDGSGDEVGQATLYDLDSAPGQLDIGHSEVIESARGQGYGEALYREIAKFAQEEGYETLNGAHVSPAANNVRSKLFEQLENNKGTSWERYGNARRDAIPPGVQFSPSRDQKSNLDLTKETRDNSLLKVDEILFKNQPSNSLRAAGNPLTSALDHLRGSNGAGQEAQGSAQESKALADWAQDNGLLLEKLPKGLKLDGPKDFGGAEHHSFYDADSNRWIKITRGSTPTGHEAFPTFGGWRLSKGQIPHRYLERLSLQNEVLGDDIVLHGVFRDKRGNTSVITSQPHVEGDPATREQINDMMSEAGFIPLGNSSFYRNDDNLLVLDLHEENGVVKDGKFIPYDAVLIHPDEELKKSVISNSITMMKNPKALVDVKFD